MTYSKNILNQYEGFFNESHSSVSVKIGSIPFLIKRRKKGQKKYFNLSQRRHTSLSDHILLKKYKYKSMNA